jgi:hypothetical protein
LHDNRTITRRQLLRENSSENWRIFIAKLIHGPGNILTYFALKKGSGYSMNPSNTDVAFEVLDRLLGTDSQPIIERFLKAKDLIKRNEFSFEQAVQIINWYESLLGTVLGHNPEAIYNYLSEEKQKIGPEMPTAA